MKKYIKLIFKGAACGLQQRSICAWPQYSKDSATSGKWQAVDVSLHSNSTVDYTTTYIWSLQSWLTRLSPWSFIKWERCSWLTGRQGKKQEKRRKGRVRISMKERRAEERRGRGAEKNGGEGKSVEEIVKVASSFVLATYLPNIFYSKLYIVELWYFFIRR